MFQTGLHQAFGRASDVTLPPVFLEESASETYLSYFYSHDVLLLHIIEGQGRFSFRTAAGEKSLPVLYLLLLIISDSSVNICSKFLCFQGRD